MELYRVDPATSIDIKCDFNNKKKLPIFKRMYICLGALKNGFKAGCKVMIGLDEAHLKSCFGGQLLTAVGIDANNTSWVVVYAMVELETKDSWTWFLELLVKDLSIENDGVGWTFISDKQKGLKSAFEDVVSSAQIRFCARHLWTNFTKLFPGKVMKDQMWKAAKSTTLPYFLKEIEEMKALDVDAYNWLTVPEWPPKHWSKTYFRTGNNCDILINNMCESFNALIIEARGKPPITMFEEIRMKLIRRIQIRKDKMAAYHGNICPRARNVIEKNKVKAVEDCISTFNGGDQAEVENIEGSKNVVDLAARICSCRRWDLIGIPCKHAISAIFGKREDVDDFVADCYLKSTYMTIYSNLIMPRHLPPKEKKTSAVSKKRKEINEAGQDSGNQSKRGKKGPMTANELRQKMKERAEYQRKKVGCTEGSKLGRKQVCPTRGRPRQATSAPTASRLVQATSRPPQAPRASTKQVATPTRSSQRIRENSGKGEGK
ncbi:uncharacterized protein LOC133735703 [Rosa rugosa]|uniref:uncharacterized protein LOC133735703 n=1 Tax=Rosa rugosa TaxID=74645 RepID=UPI002B406D74|nr:uncharacterized protein LOC133735703 [Rosa rugosa]